MSLSLLPTNTVLLNQVAVTVFGVAPGATIQDNYLEYAETNGIDATLNLLLGAAGLGDDANFNAIVLNNLGLANDAVSLAFMESSVAASGRLATMKEAFNFLGSVAGQDNQYGVAGTAFNSKTTKAIEYSAVATNTSASSDAVSDTAISTGSTFTLTTSQDTPSGTAANDIVNGVIVGAGAAGTTFGAGDNFAMGAGTDTLNVSISGDAGGAFTVTGAQATGLEKVLLSNFDQNAADTTIDATLFGGLTTVGLSASSATGDTVFSGMTSLTNAEMKSGSADLTVTHDATATAGASAISLETTNVSAGTFTAAGIETLTINSVTAASTLTDVVLAAGTNLNVTGSANLTISNDVDFADNATATAIDGTVDASEFSGVLTMEFNTGDNVSVTGGSGADNFEFTTGFSSRDVVDGGAGRDTLALDLGNATLTTTDFANVSNTEILKVNSTNNGATVNAADVASFDTLQAADNVKTVTFTGSAAAESTTATIAYTLNGQPLTSTANLAGLAAADAINASDAVAATINALDGFSAVADGTSVVTITATTGESVEIAVTDQTGATAEEGSYNNLSFTNVSNQTVDIASANNVTVTLADASGSADVLNVNLTSPTADAGFSQTISQISAANIETLNLNASGITDTDNDYIITTLTDGGTTDLLTLNITGSSSIDLSGTITAADLATVNASAFTGDLRIDGVDEDQTITGGSGADEFIMAANLDDGDTIDGGAGDDTLSATVTDLTATTGALSVANVETLNLTNAGTAVINAAGITGAEEIAILTNTTQTTISNLAAGVAVGVGVNDTDGDTDGILIASLADATGTADALTINMNDTAGANTNTVDVRLSGIETVTFDWTDATDTDVADADLDVDAINAGAIVLSGADADDTHTVTLNTLDTDTTSVTATAYNGVLTATAGAATATTFALAGDRAHNITGSTGNDVITVGETTNAAITVDGNGGTDVLNITFGDGTQTTENITDVDTINVTVSGSADIDLDAANQLAGINAATRVNISGGNALSSVILGAAGGEEVTDSNASVIDFTGYLGTVTNVVWAIDDFDDGESTAATIQVIGGSSTSDVVTADYDADTDASVAINMQAVETFNVDMADSAVELVMDMAEVTGLSLINVTDVSSERLDLNNLAAGVTVDVTSTDATATTVEIRRATTSGDESQQVNVSAASADDNVAIVMADVETLVINPESALQVDLELANVSMTDADDRVTVNFIGTNDVELVSLNADVTTINASGMGTGGAVVQTGRSATEASTYTGSNGDDTFIMMNGNDVLAGGSGTDTLDVNFTAILGGANIDLSATNQLVSFNGSASAGTVTGFENVDVSGFAGSFGAVVTGSSAANTITGSANADQISAGAGNDTIVITAGNDVVNGGAGDDEFDFTAALLAGNSETTATLDGGDGTDTLDATAASTLIDADFRGITNAETLKFSAGDSTLTAGDLFTAAGITNIDITGAIDLALTQETAQALGSASAPLQVTGYTVNSATTIFDFLGTDAASDADLTGAGFATPVAGRYLDADGTAASFFTAAAAAFDAGDIGLYVVDGNTYVFAEGAATGATDDVHLELLGVSLTSVSATHGALVFHMGA